MRIIDADAIDWSIVEDEYGKRTDSVVACEILIENQPTIEAVSVVRCKECKSWKWIEWAKEYRCTLRNTAFNARADDYCSYGERKESE